MTDNPQENARLAALRYRNYRLLWSGETISRIGVQMQQFAINWHVFSLLENESYTLTIFDHDIALSAQALGLGTLGLARFAPLVIFALIGGLLADSVDRRRLMIYTRIVAATFSFLLTLLTLTGVITVPLIYLVTSVMAATSAFDNPARQSIIPSLVPPKHLVNAISLNTLTFQIATITGPALAALTISRLDIGLVYLIDFLTFLVTIGTLLAMRLEHKVGNSRRPGGWQAIAEGFRFVHSSRLIWSTMLLDFMATFFSSTRTLLPIIANDLLGVGVSGYGVLATAQPLGSLLAGLILSMTREMRHQGPVLLGSVLVFGLATALFGLSQVFALSYVFFALTGAADTVSAVIRNTIRQLMTPDEMRGRMVGVNSIFFAGGPQLGDLEAGLVAALAGAPFAIVSGGVATVIFTIWIAWKYPRLRNYTQQPAAEEQNEGKRTED